MIRRLMTRIALVISPALIFAGISATSLRAQCPTSITVANVWGWQAEVNGTPGETLLCKFWLVGSQNTLNSGTLRQDMGFATPYSTGYYVTTNWGNTGVEGCPGFGEVLNGTRTAFLYSIANNGAAQYLVMSTAWNSFYSRYAFDDITNGNSGYGPNIETPLMIPSLAANPQTPSNGIMTVNLVWKSIENLKGFYDTAPDKNLITGVAVRYYQGISKPSSFKTSDWKLAGVVNFGDHGTDPGRATVQLPDNADLQTYVALSILFDGSGPGGFAETDFVGQPTLVLFSPAFFAEFGNVSAVLSGHPPNINVSFTMVAEQGVKSYTVEGSRSPMGLFMALTTIPAEGNGAYGASVPKKGTKAIRIRATLGDGSEITSKVVAVGRNRRH